jgi:hypothetical protein
MGYSTDFDGAFDITNPLSPEQIKFIQMFSDVVLGVEHRFFGEALDRKKETRGISLDT